MRMLFRTKASLMNKGFKNQQRAKQIFTVVLIRVSHRYVLMALILSLIILGCTNKPRFQPEAGNAPHCGSAASQEGGA